jgi:aminoglycoside phosphotransferase family enzyme/gluconate kinase
LGTDPLHELILEVQKNAAFDHPVTGFELIETHISYVLLTGHYAYKFKKPVDLSFLDFSTLEKRKFFCEEELRLNRRFAPALYLDVISITGPPERPALNGDGEVLEYAVKMLQFPRGMELEHIQEKGLLTLLHIDDLAERIAQYHQSANIAAGDGTFGTTLSIRQAALDNFSIIRSSTANSGMHLDLKNLEQWTLQTSEQLRTFMEDRRQHGFIRECHGDLHLGNIVLYDEKPLPFDCIEFSESLRWIDIINEIAFLMMDIEARDEHSLAYRFLNRYLQIIGDYEGLGLLRFYCVYRALVRCKVASIRLAQHDLTPSGENLEREHVQHYLDLAGQYIAPRQTPLFITHGFSGSGKTTWTQALLEKIGAIRVRSDVERKRLHGHEAEARTASDVQSGIYSRNSTSVTYERLLQLAEVILRAGYPVIVDATFLKQEMRSRFYQLAKDLNVAFRILDFHAEEAELRRRVKDRQNQGIDASEAGTEVLEYQLHHCEPLSESEKEYVITIETSSGDEEGLINRQLKVVTAAFE